MSAPTSNDCRSFPPFPGDDVDAPSPSIADLERSLAKSRRRVHCVTEDSHRRPSDVRHASNYYRNEKKAAECNHVEGVLNPSEKEYNEIILGLRHVGVEVSQLVERLVALARF